MSATRTRRSIRRHLVVGLAGAFALVLGMGGWAATTELAGAIIAPGLLVAQTNVKLVQHPAGGVVVELNVADGDLVEAGDVLARLDDTTIRSSLDIVLKSLQQLEAREARLLAELEETDTIAFPQALVGATDPAIRQLLKSETALFELRRATLASQEGQLTERVSQLEEEISGIERQLSARERERALIETELTKTRALLAQELISSERVSELDRQMAQIEGQIGQLQASVAQGRGRIAETELQVLQSYQTFRSDAAEELSVVQAKIAELRERRIAGESELAKTSIRAPQAGQVHELAIHTIGGVAGAGETLMRIVPIDEALSVEVHVAPQDIDQIHVGQLAVVRFSAFNLRTTPELNGTVVRVSPDLTYNQQTGAAHYTARIELAQGELDRLGGLTLTSGMPVEAFIETGRRTALNYLTKPLADQIARAFRSD